MKRIVLLLTIFLIGANFSYAQQEKNAEQTTKEAKKAEKEAKKAAKKAEKEAKKAQEEAKDSLLFVAAMKALEMHQFVLEAEQVEFKRGQTSHVSGTTNFVMLDDKKASIQIASNKGIAGPNGIGGITVEGDASHIEMKTDKKGNVSFEMSVQGIGVSARVSFRMTKGTNHCSATVLPNFNSNRISFSGKLLPLKASKVFKGKAL